MKERVRVGVDGDVPERVFIRVRAEFCHVSSGLAHKPHRRALGVWNRMEAERMRMRGVVGRTSQRGGLCAQI